MAPTNLQQQYGVKAFRKVPQITLLFWVIKLLTTAMGEVSSDFLVHQINPIIAVLLSSAILLLALFFQFRSKRYVPSIYWFCVAMVSVVGTMGADIAHIGLGIPYVFSTAFFSLALSGTFFLWYQCEKTLSIHSITTPRREMFYWLTVILTFALGTATGDMSATTYHLGYLYSGVLFTACMCIPVFGYRKLQRYEVGFFWFAYILTRPIGASFADWIGRSKEFGGLGLGTGIVSAILIVCILVGVGRLQRHQTKALSLGRDVL